MVVHLQGVREQSIEVLVGGLVDAHRPAVSVVEGEVVERELRAPGAVGDLREEVAVPLVVLEATRDQLVVAIEHETRLGSDVGREEAVLPGRTVRDSSGRPQFSLPRPQYLTP